MQTHQNTPDQIHTKSTRVKEDYRLRITGCIVILCLHFSLLWGEAPAAIWLFIFGHTLLYPHLAYYFADSWTQEKYNLCIDGFAYGVCIALWGFNPFVSTVLIAGFLMTAVAADGIGFLGRVSILIAVGSGSVLLFYGVHFRENVPLLTSLIAAIGLLAYCISLGISIYSVNKKLVKTKLRLTKQTESLKNISQLAQAVNSDL
ncbi:MAG: hypothetical protein MI864_06420, partial [Pseudomonadales bacterium]|nr:hypothetical protein [Pseudomonadales bacterium]